MNLFNNLLQPWGSSCRTRWCAPPWAPRVEPGILNVPAVLIVAVLTWLLVRGIKESSRVNLTIVIVKVAVIVFFIALAVWHVNPANWQPFMPFGFGGVNGRGHRLPRLRRLRRGLDRGRGGRQSAARHADRDHGLARGGDVLYMVVAAIMTGVVPYKSWTSPTPWPSSSTS